MRRYKVYVCFVILKKAFDRALHGSFEYGTIKKCIPEIIFAMAKFFSEVINLWIIMDTKVSEEFQITVDVYQEFVVMFIFSLWSLLSLQRR